MTSPVVQHLAGLLTDRPEVVSAVVNERGNLVLTCPDGSTLHLLVAHEGPASDRTPAAPSWPGVTRAQPVDSGTRRRR